MVEVLWKMLVLNANIIIYIFKNLLFALYSSDLQNQLSVTLRKKYNHFTYKKGISFNKGSIY